MTWGRTGHVVRQPFQPEWRTHFKKEEEKEEEGMSAENSTRVSKDLHESIGGRLIGRN